MKEIKEYLKRPETVRKIVVGVFVLGIMWANLNNKIDVTTERVKVIESYNIGTKLAEIQVDIAWIKQVLSSQK